MLRVWRARLWRLRGLRSYGEVFRSTAFIGRVESWSSLLPAPHGCRVTARLGIYQCVGRCNRQYSANSGISPDNLSPLPWSSDRLSPRRVLHLGACGRRGWKINAEAAFLPAHYSFYHVTYIPKEFWNAQKLRAPLFLPLSQLSMSSGFQKERKIIAYSWLTIISYFFIT